MTVRELYESIGGSYESALKVMQMEKLVSKFIVRFLDDTTHDRLADAATRKDAVGMFEASHSMKGVCANLGLDSLSAKAARIADEFRPGRERTMSEDEVDALLASLEEQYARSIEGIRRFASEQA